LTNDFLNRKLLINRSRITELTGREPRHYCYPSGVYRPQFLPWLARHDVSSATTCDPGLAHARATRSCCRDFWMLRPYRLLNSRAG
jgi:hypothetical protein